MSHSPFSVFSIFLIAQAIPAAIAVSAEIDSKRAARSSRVASSSSKVVDADPEERANAELMANNDKGGDDPKRTAAEQPHTSLEMAFPSALDGVAPPHTAPPHKPQPASAAAPAAGRPPQPPQHPPPATPVGTAASLMRQSPSKASFPSLPTAPPPPAPLLASPGPSFSPTPDGKHRLLTSVRRAMVQGTLLLKVDGVPRKKYWRSRFIRDDHTFKQLQDHLLEASAGCVGCSGSGYGLGAVGAVVQAVA